MYKLRHMNEIKLYNEYVSRIGMNVVPTLVIGHTHEVRNDAARTIGASSVTELTKIDQRIVSWSEGDGKLKKIIWKNNHGVLKHHQVVWIDL